MAMTCKKLNFDTFGTQRVKINPQSILSRHKATFRPSD